MMCTEARLLTEAVPAIRLTMHAQVHPISGISNAKKIGIRNAVYTRSSAKIMPDQALEKVEKGLMMGRPKTDRDLFTPQLCQ